MASVLSSLSMAGTSGIGPGTVFHDRLEEEQFFRTRGPPDLPLDVIRHVWMSFIGARDLALLFENGERRYALVIKVEDPAALGWKECQAVVDALKLVERGTRVSNESFTEMFAHFKTKYGRTEGPKIEHGILMGTVFPNRGTLQSEAPNELKSTGIAFDRDGDVMVRSETFGGQKYAVYVELSTKGQQQTLPSKKQALYKLDVRVLVDLLTLLETGDKVAPTDFLAGMAELREKYQFVSVDRFDGGKLVAGSVLASRVRNREPMPEILAKALNRKRAKDAGVPSPPPPAGPGGGTGPPQRDLPPVPGSGLPRCPYPGCTYVRRLKESGQAKVYAGRYDGKDVAIKVFMEEDSTAVYKRELTMLLKMARHPNVINVLDFWEAPEPCVVMDLVKGADMMDHLEKNGPMASNDARRVALALADGINHLHRNGVVHRDLKSSNILIDENGAPIIIDLGLGGALEARAKPKGGMDMRTMCATFLDSCSMAQSEGLLGTVLWVAPEMATGNLWGKPTDVYAFGIMMWELLSGKIPFVKPGEEPSPMNILVRIAGGERPDLRDVRGADKDLVDLMQACWAQDPKKRPSMRHVVDALSGRDPVAIFREVDSNNDKELDFHEFSDFLKRYAPGKVHPAQIYDVFSAIDVNKDGSINLEEFQEFWRQVDTFGLEKALVNCQAGQQGPMNNEDVRHWINS